MKIRHLAFSELVKLTKTQDRSSKRVHLDECERCLAGYAVALALVSKSKEGKEPVEIIIGDITPLLRSLEGTSEPKLIGKPDTLGVQMYQDAHGLSLQVVSGRYEIGEAKIKIYKRTKEAGQLIAVKRGLTDKNGFIRMGHKDKENMDDSNCQYLISVTGLLKPLQKICPTKHTT
ncbi:MAG: hypothetical protein ACM3SR_18735 [Ignavibacteriales bacterium]